MKKLLLLVGLLWSAVASAQFTSGQLLTAAALSSAFAGKAPIPTGTCLGSGFALNYTLGTNTFSCNGTIDAVTLSSHTFQSPGPIGSVSPSTASFTNLTANGTLTFANGSLPLSYLAIQSANTLVGNATGSTASPTAITVTGCNGVSQALQWTNGSGFGCNSSVATSGANANITSLSGLSTPLSVPQGGTGGSSLAQYQPLAGSGTGAITTLGTGTTGQVLMSNGGSAYPSFQNITSLGSPINGVTDGSTAGAGIVGEPQTATASSVNLTTSATPTDCLSKSLTAGDWMVFGWIAYKQGSGSFSPTQITSSLSTTSGTQGSTLSTLGATFTTNFAQALPVPMILLNVSSSTTVYLVGQATFASGTPIMNCSLTAVRYH